MMTDRTQTSDQLLNSQPTDKYTRERVPIGPYGHLKHPDARPAARITLIRAGAP